MLMRGGWYSLVVGERIPAHASVERAGVVRVLADGAEIKHPELLPVSVLEKPPRVLPAVAVEALEARRRIAHDDDPVRDIRQI